MLELISQEMDEMLETGRREHVYEKYLHAQSITYEAERARRLRTQMLLAMDENDNLQSQIDEDDNRIEVLELEKQGLQDQLSTDSKTMERLQHEIRAKTREIETLRAELTSLQAMSVDSSKILTEKLALSRELFALKPELEHLRAQTVSNQNLLSEKLSLQRQLSSVQVELETERRAAQRAHAKEGDKSAADAQLEAQLQQLQAELAKERRERQKIERDAQKASAEFEGKKTILESRLDAFRNKLRLTKEQLKESQSEAQNRANSLALTGNSRFAETADPKARNPRKRNISQVADDTMIGTPGLEPAAKRGKRGSTAPGEKSTFSITPFLNRTGSLAPESPRGSSPENPHIGEASEARVSSVALNDTSPSAKASRAASTKEKSSTVMVVSKSSKLNTKPARRTGSSKLSIPRLEQVTEDNEDQNDEPEQQPNVTKENGEVQKVVDQAQPVIKKKRKLLNGGPGKTLFDDDDGDVPKIERGALGDSRAFGALGRTGLGFGQVKLGQKVKTATAGGFGAFSPLKKDRKFGASILGA